jgi:SAM-dependent methyltransferase
MRNPELWRPTKIAVLSRKVEGVSLGVRLGVQVAGNAADAGPEVPTITAPADPRALAAGSTLIATLVGRWYAMALARHARGALLELGAGALPYHALYRSRVGEVWCTDWPSSFHPQPHADLYCDLNAGIPMRADAVDTVVAADVLEHIYRPQALLAEVFRVLRPGGTALVNTPFMYGVHEAPHDYFRYTPHALARMAADAGFEAVGIDALGGSACVLADIAGKLLQGQGRAGAWLARTLQRALLGLLAPLPRSESSPLVIAAVLRKPQGLPSA